MRSHGAANFPDPSPSGGFELIALGAELGSPAFLAAQNACAKVDPGGSRRPAPFTGDQKRQMVAKARCIRTHGVPGFPDPTTVGPGTFFAEPYLPAGFSFEAPAVVHALHACAHVGITIPSDDGGVG
jgi:hypothetical protein